MTIFRTKQHIKDLETGCGALVMNSGACGGLVVGRGVDEGIVDAIVDVSPGTVVYAWRVAVCEKHLKAFVANGFAVKRYKTG